MFKNKNTDGLCNICGKNVAKIRKAIVPMMSQRALADKMQLNGIDIDKNAIQKLEAGKRFVTDIELIVLAKVLSVTVDDLLKDSENA